MTGHREDNKPESLLPVRTECKAMIDDGAHAGEAACGAAGYVQRERFEVGRSYRGWELSNLT